MNIENIGVIVSIVAAICAGTIFIVSRLLQKAKHEQMQDEDITNIKNARSVCMANRVEVTNELEARVSALERKNHDVELVLVSLQTTMETLVQNNNTTQTMIQRLEDHQQKTFMQLIDTIKSIKSS